MIMDAQKIAHFKSKLEEELETLEKELGTVGIKGSGVNKDDWEPVPQKMDIDQADRNEVADFLEEFGNNIAINNDLEIRLSEIKKALKKIEDGTYGICEISGTQIEEDRLEANPAARTCKAHINE